MAQMVGPCCRGWRFDSSFRLPALTWSSPGCCKHLWSKSVHLFACLSVPLVKKQTATQKKRLKTNSVNYNCGTQGQMTADLWGHTESSHTLFGHVNKMRSLKGQNGQFSYKSTKQCLASGNPTPDSPLILKCASFSIAGNYSSTKRRNPG